jgi:hypothetical protein
MTALSTIPADTTQSPIINFDRAHAFKQPWAAVRKLKRMIEKHQLTTSAGFVAIKLCDDGRLEYAPVVVLSDAETQRAFALAVDGVYVTRR